MSDIFNEMKESNKSNWQNNKETKSVLSSPATDEGLSEASVQESDKSRRNSDDLCNSSVKEQIFHPSDKIF